MDCQRFCAASFELKSSSRFVDVSGLGMGVTRVYAWGFCLFHSLEACTGVSWEHAVLMVIRVLSHAKCLGASRVFFWVRVVLA